MADLQAVPFFKALLTCPPLYACLTDKWGRRAIVNFNRFGGVPKWVETSAKVVETLTETEYRESNISHGYGVWEEIQLQSGYAIRTIIGIRADNGFSILRGNYDFVKLEMPQIKSMTLVEFAI